MDSPTRPAAVSRAATAPHRRFLPIPPAGDTANRGLYPGEPTHCRRDLRQFLPIWAHLGLLLAIIKVYRVEGRALFLLTSLATVALPIHYLSPFRWKKPFFLGLSLAGLFTVFGPAPATAAAGLVAAFVAMTRLPVAWTIRAGLVAACGLGLALLRGIPGLSSGEFASLVWPVAASMLMFRMILYLYETKHNERPETLMDTFGYFFLLPNYAFLHFPVVDYRTLLRSHFSAEVHATQRVGSRMIFKGVTHLLAYRLIYHQLLIPIEEVRDLATLAGFVVCNYLLYLRVSGQFHIACGMLHLFGYQLPETHHNYLLATGFTDYWRRINIYWKDFMVRVVFHPVAFRLKRWPDWQGLTIATSAVFLATWSLHAYQSFWLRGTWGFSGPDALFWGILGILVAINVQFDARAAARPRPRPSFQSHALRVAKTLGTFVTIALLWSLWSSPSVAAWTAMFHRALG